MIFRVLIFLTSVISFSVYADISVIDDTGQQVTLKKPAKRIISLAPHATEMLFGAGAGEYIVGAVNFSNYPLAARNIPRVGNYTQLDFEVIVSLKPDLIIAWKSGNAVSQLQKLRSLGFVIYTSEPRKIDDIPASLERLGKLAGTQSIATKAALEFRKEHVRLQTMYSGQKKITVFYEIWNRPLMTINGQHLISNVIKLCGGDNVFSDLTILAPKIDIEAVLDKNPEVIIASVHVKPQPVWRDQWQHWPHLKATRNNNLYFIPPDIILRNSPRILQGARMLCEHLANARGKQSSASGLNQVFQ